MRLESLLLGCVACAWLGCGEPQKGTTPVPTSSAIDTQPPSPTALVRFKGNEVLANDLARGLSLEPTAICNELGAFSCTNDVHKVTLGGVDPYERQIYEPIRATTATTPLAAERVVLSACLERAHRDFGGAQSPSLFVGLPLDGVTLSDPHAAAVASSIDALYVSLLARHAQKGEISALENYYSQVAASGDATPAQTWAALSCFAVGSSVEFLFY